MTHEQNLILTQKKLEDIEYALNQSYIIAITDHEGVIQFVNDKFCEISQYSRDELIGSNHRILNSNYHSKAFFKDLWQTISSGQIWQGEVRNERKDGTYYWVSTTIVPFLNEAGKPYQYLAIRHEITKKKEYELIIKEMAYTDSLTKLPNRNWLKEWARTQPNGQDKSFSLFSLEIDRFRELSMNLGQDASNHILLTVANRIKTCLSVNDLFYRSNEDGFKIISENAPLSENEALIQKLLQIAKEPIRVEEHELHIDLNIGLARGEMPGDTIDALRVIDTLSIQAHAMKSYGTRQNGERVHLFTENESVEWKKMFLIELQVKEALAKNEFHLVYQPLIDLQQNKMIGVETLLRWDNKTLGNVYPNQFIPILEDKGYIIPVGKWVVQAACMQMKAWQDQGLFLERISVNVSPVQFKDPLFISDLQAILEQTKLDPDFLEIEITEGTLFDIDHATIILNELKKIGVKISIDDFGTGYSSLSYLRKLPIDTLKIDKSFIDGLEDYDGEIIVNTIISMGKHLKFRVIAEGIESKKQLEYLQRKECAEGQGYYFSKPVKSAQIEAYYAAP